MKTSISHTNEQGTSPSLHFAVDQLLQTSVAATNLNKNSIVNNIAPDLYITSHDEVILSVIEKILQGSDCECGWIRHPYFGQRVIWEHDRSKNKR